MSGLTSITDSFGDGLHTFRLPFGQLEELQERTGVGPAVLLGRLVDGTWRVGDLRETIRLALIGGGEMTASDALKFVTRYVDGEPLSASLSAAIAILVVTLNGRRVTAAAPPGEPGAAKSATDPDGSTSPPSADPLPSSASAPPS